MTKLDCTVTNCLHNADNCCCKQAIIVDGHGAHDCSETCCGFDENKEGAFKNVFKTPESRLEIDCEAINCIYNEGRHCQAEHINVSGDGASRAEHTQCATFKER